MGKLFGVLVVQKPSVVEAVQFVGDGTTTDWDLYTWVRQHGGYIWANSVEHGGATLTTKYGPLPVKAGDWVVRNHDEEFEVHDRDSFYEKYELYRND